MSFPANFYVHTASVEPYLGQDANGPRFGAAVAVRGYLKDNRKLVLTSTGEDAVSESTFYTYPANASTFTSDSRVSVNGRKTRVIGVKRHESGRLRLPDHLEVQLF